ncbi:hypothetical protein G9X50_20460 [Cronobacter sakazakii]|uniref:hypothetical protein n=1 Tax=Cronobacter TaxID=413496 RepID=UPI000B4A802B|nr:MULTISPECIES: hypothetical protein [Cronobacter]ELQ6222955.1 hypothetical protein [Cronobacter turicensis]EIZ9238774.1 hypothetical protein [Cronobacter sakazakii]EKK4045224.1 hypothetical protein [Cronobacter sakazakii]ELQ6264692.1 hypothetical protein [Cronobacter malonaticus]ELY2592604.1 hypothetical protein [Cronobacter sakazakii]
MEEIKELLKKARTNAECGEHLSPAATIKLIDDVEHYLEKHETDDATNRHLYFYSAQTIDGNIFSGVAQLTWRITSYDALQNFKFFLSDTFGYEFVSVDALSYLGREKA